MKKVSLGDDTSGTSVNVFPSRINAVTSESSSFESVHKNVQVKSGRTSS